jgi:VWFA-related protein
MSSSRRGLLCAAMLLVVCSVFQLRAQNESPPVNVPTIQVTSRLVFLDVTVLDKKGHPVVTGLSKDDFIITEDKKLQRIFSFEEPATHSMDANAGDDNPDGKAPVTIFVLDLLNSNFEDFAFIRDSVRKYLASEPMQLSSPAELMVIGNQSLEMVQGYTRNKEDLLYALDHLPPMLPYKMMNSSFFVERFVQSIDALQQIALQNKGVPGRKNIVWVGHGGPNLSMAAYNGLPVLDELKEYSHTTTNMLVDARITLFVIYPELIIHGTNMVPGPNGTFTVRGINTSTSAMDADSSIGDDEPFSGDINFGLFVNETGGKLFYNRNDIDNEIRRSEQLGSEYYTLTYQPHEGNADGKFRRIRVTLRDPHLRAMTKVGYFGPDKNAAVDPRQQTMINMTEAAQSTIPFTALDMKVFAIARHPDTRSAEIMVELDSKNLGWLPTENGKSRVNLNLAAMSLTGNLDVLASKTETVTQSAPTQDPAQLAKEVMRIKLTIRVPRKTQSVRVVVQTEVGGRIGAADLDRRTIDATPATPTPEPQLVSHQPN